ncbi:MAG: bifunctional 4-hydroxy-2-oxoglutarate aldolase/2-dehydro-3-deoxy-phosphogluconate aldolase [Cyclobacteriaceae bacterium]|nr:MAG: bifunctional 4-hydroxy-2-oxoglutarate aldolase/2-dehydro-3-deoxy-phosphogluconate aldolase [Cyclobacteriaceae bacterium]
MDFSKQQILSIIKETGFVPLLSHNDANLAQLAMEAAYRGGVRAFEYTNRQPNSFEVFTHLLRVAEKLPGLTLGIGTIMDAATTEKYIQAGAHFIISPILKPEMAPVCHAHEKLWIPGCATLTEIVTAKEMGAALIKLFPGSVLGPGFVKSIMPVVPDLQLMITGGVEPTEKSISEWFGAGAACVGLGSQLFTKEVFEKQDWKKLELTVRYVLEVIRSVNPKTL